MTHYTGIGTEIRENYHNESLEKAKVVVNMPEGLGRYGIEDAKGPDNGSGAGYIPNVKFEWYLKNHLGSTMLVYGTEGNATSDPFTLGTPLAAYDYRAFGEQLTLLPAGDKFTENFTGSRFTRRTLRTACKSIAEPKNLGAKRNERDDEIALNYFGARYLDPMLGMWISVDPKRQFASPYLYAGNGMNPINVTDQDGNYNLYKVGDELVFRFSSWQETFYFQYMTNVIPFGKTMHYFMAKNNKSSLKLVSSSNIPTELSALDVAFDAVSFLSFIDALKVGAKVASATSGLQIATQFGSRFDFWAFDSYMAKLTTPIRGSSIEDINAKIAWAVDYAMPMYQNHVEITNDVREAFDASYRQKFYPVVEEE